MVNQFYWVRSELLTQDIVDARHDEAVKIILVAVKLVASVSNSDFLVVHAVVETHMFALNLIFVKIILREIAVSKQLFWTMCKTTHVSVFAVGVGTQLRLVRDG